MTHDDQPAPLDPTKVTEQPALTFSTGRIWLVVGGLFTVIALAVLIPQTVAGLPPVGVPLAAAIVDLLLYAGMIAARVVVPVTRLRRRLALMAIGMLAIAAVSLAAVLIVGFAAASAAATT
jgi:ABC-type transport system involved in cytochrome c biogenesis permease subunit